MQYKITFLQILRRFASYIHPPTENYKSVGQCQFQIILMGGYDA